MRVARGLLAPVGCLWFVLRKFRPTLVVVLLLYVVYGFAGLGLLVFGAATGDWEKVWVGLFLVFSYGLFFLSFGSRIR